MSFVLWKGAVTAMSIVAHAHQFVVGVDTHARNHVYAILAATTGALLESRSFPTTASGINRAINWVARRTGADAGTLWVIEGAATYGAILVGAVACHGYPVAEVPRMDARKHRGVGNTDALDAHQIAVATLPLLVEKLRRPRLNYGIRQAVRILTTARGAMSADRTRSVNALNALVRSNNLGVDARKSLTASQTSDISCWRPREEELSLSVARNQAIRLEKHILGLEEQLANNEKQLDELIRVSEAAPLLEEKGFRAISAAKCLTARLHEGRVGNEAAFASGGRKLHPRLFREHHQASAEPGRRQGTQQRTAHGRGNADDSRCKNASVRGKTTRRRPHRQGNPPLHQTLRGPPHQPDA